MSNKDFKLKNGLIVPSLSTAGVVKTDASGVITSSATLSLTEGGTGQTTAANALNALLPLQTGNTNYFLQTNQTTSQWAKVYNQTIKNNGTTVTPRGIVNIIGGTFADSSGTDTTTIDLSGYISTSGGSTITTSSASVKPLIIQGAASQSASLQEWQDSAGSVLAKVSATGALTSSGSMTITNGAVVLAVNQVVYSPTYSLMQFGASIKATNYYTSVPTFIVQGPASQTANLQEWQNSAGYSQALTPRITASGAIEAGDSNYIGYKYAYFSRSGATGLVTWNQQDYAGASLVIATGNAGSQGLIVKGAASQTANLQEWQDSAAVVRTQISPSGVLTLRPVAYAANQSAGIEITDTTNSWSTAKIRLVSDGAGNPRLGIFAPSVAIENISVQGGSVGIRTAAPLAILHVSTAGAASIGTIMQGAASQSANLQEWQNSAGTILAKVNAAGNIGIGSGTTALSYGLDVFTGSARIWNGITGAGQTGTLYLGDGSLTKSYGAGWEINGGLVTSGGYGISSTANLDAGGTTLGYGRLSVNTGATTTVGAVIRGVASQTANLQQWQNSSGTVLSKVDSNGIIYSPTAASGTNTTQVATTEFVSTAVNNLIDSAPGTLNTLNEIAAALNDDPNFSSTITTLNTALSSQDTYSLMGVF